MAVSFTTFSALTAFNADAVGTKVIDQQTFTGLLLEAIESHDPSGDRAEGQHFIMLPPAALETVSAGVGRRTTNADDYVVRIWRGRADLFLKRECAEQVTGCAAIVYTRDAYLADPEVDEAEEARVLESGASHVLVAVLAFAGPQSQFSPHRFTSNLAGGNNEALAWTADEIREKAQAVIAYDNEWCVVAD